MKNKKNILFITLLFTTILILNKSNGNILFYNHINNNLEILKKDTVYKTTKNESSLDKLTKQLTDSLHLKLNFTDSQYRKACRILQKEAAILLEGASTDILKIKREENNKSFKKFLKVYQYNLFIIIREKEFNTLLESK